MGCVIHPIAYVKVLDVHVDTLLTFRVDISYICSKACRSICAVSRLSLFLTVEGKLQVMNSYIHVSSHFKCCSLIWHFCSTNDTRKIENVQYRALKYMYNNFNTSYCDLWARSHIQLLYIELQRAILEEVYEIYHSICPAYVNELLQRVQNI